MSAPAPGRPLAPGTWRMLIWLALVGAGVGVLAALVLAVLGVGAAAGGADLFASLVPAILTLGPAMAVPPFLLATLGLMVALRPPRRLSHDVWAVVIGGSVGAFAGPALFYTASPALGFSVAFGLLLVLVPAYVVVVYRLWASIRAQG